MRQPIPPVVLGMTYVASHLQKAAVLVQVVVNGKTWDAIAKSTPTQLSQTRMFALWQALSLRIALLVPPILQQEFAIQLVPLVINKTQHFVTDLG